MPVPGSDSLISLIVGIIFVILAIAAIMWGRSEEKRYYNGLVTKTDMREYVSHWPPRPWLGAVKTGGWIGLAIGLILLGIGFYFWFA